MCLVSKIHSSSSLPSFPAPPGARPAPDRRKGAGFLSPAHSGVYQCAAVETARMP